MIYAITVKGTTFWSKRKMDVIYKHVTYSRRDRVRLVELTKRNFDKLTTKKVALGGKS